MSFMDQKPTLVLVLKPACLLLILLITNSGDGKPTEAAQFVGRKLADASHGFISIDCGASENYKDPQTGIDYESDSNYMNAGMSNETFLDSTTPPNFPQQIKRLRSFPEGHRNCYTLKPARGRDNNYLIRAIFYYGNYDGKNQTPSFDLYLGVNRFSTIKDRFSYYEIIHVPSRDYIDVCLVNTGNGVPYISALELRPLDNSAYKVGAGALSCIRRYNCGGNGSIRYPDDVYDRFWIGLEFDDWTSISTSKTIYTRGSDDVYKLPKEVLRTAAESENASVPLSLYFSPPDSASNCNVYFHFAEIQKLQNSEQRELRIDLDGKRNLTESFKLEYLKPQTIDPNDPPIRGSRVHFSVYAAEGSQFPPILNAVEVYVSVDLPLSPTDLNDVNAILDIKTTYGVTKDWQGDPCVPSNFSWEGLNCSVDSTPRITSLNLSSSNLNGAIPNSISKFQALQSLDLSYNELTGPLPEFLGEMPNLRVLNLAGNRLKGSVPDALMEKSNRTLQLSLDENPDLCLLASCQEKKEKKFVIPVIASISGVLIALFLLTALAIYRRKKQRETFSKSKKEGSLRSRNRPFTYSEIVGITENFRTTIGEGGFGRVYHGTLKDGTEVAVKMLSPSSKQGYKEFRAEAQLLMIVHHRNLLSLIGYCDESQKMALVYEYMANGNLKEHLSEKNLRILNWNERLQIAVEAAHGLEYLHNGCSPPIVHRDLKTSNILLNANMRAKIADFGLSRAFLNETGSHLSTSPAGTPGYLDPEFHASGMVNKKSDVYSFGIILFELVTGRPAVMRRAGINTHIVQWVTPIIESGDVESIVDPRLQREFETHSAWKIVEIAMSCVATRGIQRPEMSDVLAELKECSGTAAAPGRTWMMHGNRTRSNNSLNMTYLEPDSVPSPR